MRSAALLLTTAALLTGCASAPRPVQVLEVCPKVPPLELQIESDALEHTFLDRIAAFLSGRLPEPPSFRPNYELAAPGTKLPAQR